MSNVWSPSVARVAGGSIIPGGGGGGGNVAALFYAPFGEAAGPAVFDDWGALYAALEALRAASNARAVVEIGFIGKEGDAEALIIPAGDYDMTGCSWVGVGHSPTPSITLATECFVSNLQALRNLILYGPGGDPADRPLIFSGIVNALDVSFSGQKGTGRLIRPAGGFKLYLDGMSSLTAGGGVYIPAGGSPGVSIFASGQSTVDPAAVQSENEFASVTFYQLDGQGVGCNIAQTALSGDGDLTVSATIGRFNVRTQLFGDLNLDTLNICAPENPGPAVFTLPAGTGIGAGSFVAIKATDAAGLVQINGGGDANTIDGQASFDLNPFEAVTLVFDGTSNWMILNHYAPVG